MQKVAILTHISHREDVIAFLHDEGVLEVREADHKPGVEHSEVTFRAADVHFAVTTLKDVASKETLAVAQKHVSVDDVIKTTNHTDTLDIVQQLRALEEDDTSAEREIQEAKGLQQELDPWIALPYMLNESTDTQSTACIFGSIPTKNLVALHDALRTDDLEKTELEEISKQKSDTYCAIHVWKQDQQVLEETLTQLGWTTIQLPEMDGTPKQVLEQLRLKQGELTKKKEQNHQKRVKLSIELPKLVQVATFLQWLDEKHSVREAMSETEQTSTLLGWMPRDQVDLVEDRLQKKIEAIAFLKIDADEGEEPPVHLKNSKWITPFESVTGLYGLPLFNEMDPTKALSPFFILYFALCLTDAGYGAIIAIIFGTVLWKTKKSIDEARLIWLLFFCGIVTFLVSIPFGGWLGFTPEQVPSIFTKQTADGLMFRGQVWNLNAESGVTFLQNLSLFLGITHLFFGMFLAGWHKWVHGKKAEALWVDFTSHLLLGGVIFYALAPENLQQIALYTLYTTLAIFIWGKGYGSAWHVRPVMGLLGLLNFVIGMISNGLSYLRILALGLVTGAIAAAVNQVAVEMGKLFPIYIAIPVIITIFVMGHIISIALNTLGSFIHSGRLQFIEFFSQFFEGGGRPFTPFRRSTS